MGGSFHGHTPTEIRHSRAGIVFSICGCITFQLAVASSIWRTVREHKQLYISQVCTTDPIMARPTNETQLWVREEGHERL